MKIISFILHRSAYAINWNTFIEQTDPHMILILIGNRESIAKLSIRDKENFKHIIEIKEYSFETLKQFIQPFLSQYYSEGDQSRIGALYEFDMLLAAQLREHFKEPFNMVGPGTEIIDNFRNKLKMKTLLSGRGVSLPRYTLFNPHAFKENSEAYLDSIEKQIQFPIFVKPIDSAGSMGTAFIENRNSLEAWCKQFENANQIYEIDQFIDGDLFHCDSIIQNGKIQFTFVSQYLHPNADARAGKALATMTMDSKSEEYRELKEFAENTLSFFPILPDGITHLEVFKTPKNELIFLEVAARPPGAKAPDMYKIRTNGIDIRALHLRLNLGLSIEHQLTHLNDASRWGPFASMYQLVAPPEGGVILNQKKPIFSSSHFETTWNYEEGTMIPPNFSITDAVVSTLFWNNNYAEFKEDFENLDQQKLFDVNPRVSPSPQIGLISHLVSSVCKKGDEVISSGVRFFDRAIETAQSYAKEVTTECKSYFTEDLNLWSGNGTRLSFFPNSTSLHNGTNTSALPSQMPLKLRN